MKYKYLILIGASLFSIASLKAQDTLATHLTYDLTAETAVGTGDYTAFQVTANRHHVLGTRSNTAYLRGAVSIEHPFTEKAQAIRHPRRHCIHPRRPQGLSATMLCESVLSVFLRGGWQS